MTTISPILDRDCPSCPFFGDSGCAHALSPPDYSPSAGRCGLLIADTDAPDRIPRPLTPFVGVPYWAMTPSLQCRCAVCGVDLTQETRLEHWRTHHAAPSIPSKDGLPQFSRFSEPFEVGLNAPEIAGIRLHLTWEGPGVYAMWMEMGDCPVGCCRDVPLLRAMPADEYLRDTQIPLETSQAIAALGRSG